MAFIIQYRTRSIELMDKMDLWYEGDNHFSYESVEDALANSDIVSDWQFGPCDLTVVRLVDPETGEGFYISPFAVRKP